MELSQFHDPCCELYGLVMLIWIIFFCLFLIIFLFYLLTLSLLSIELYNLFWFAFYRGILISWPGSRVLRISYVDSCHFFVYFLIIFLILSFNFGLIGIKLYNFLWFAFYRVISVFWLGFVELTRVDSSHFLSFIYLFF
jgi:hypothetical protein